MTKVTLTNDFHGTRVTLHVPEDGILSAFQVRRAVRELCNNSECLCGGALGERGLQTVQIEELTGGRVRLVSNVHHTETPWQSLVLRDADGDEIRGDARIRYLLEFQTSGSMSGVFFDRIGAAYETPDDASTWGPATPAVVDWAGFPG